jgi:hypothetical protein
MGDSPEVGYDSRFTGELLRAPHNVNLEQVPPIVPRDISRHSRERIHQGADDEIFFGYHPYRDDISFVAKALKRILRKLGDRHKQSEATPSQNPEVIGSITTLTELEGQLAA